MASTQNDALYDDCYTQETFICKRRQHFYAAYEARQPEFKRNISRAIHYFL